MNAYFCQWFKKAALDDCNSRLRPSVDEGMQWDRVKSGSARWEVICVDELVVALILSLIFLRCDLNENEVNNLNQTKMKSKQ